jgi:hypothetical protein
MRWMRAVWVAALSLGLGFPLAAAEEPAEQALKARADRLWEARVKGEWASVYEFLLPEEQTKLTQEQYVISKKEKGPVHYLSAEIGEVAVAGDTGWVEVNYLWRPSAYSALPPTQAHLWEVWQKREDWRPLSKELREQVPSRPPHVRPAAEEAALGKRAEAFWQAKEAQDWRRLYEYLEPGYRAQEPIDAFLKKKSVALYLTHRLEWVEVSDEHGRVKVAYTHRPNDPTLTKLDPRESTVIEDWIKVQGQWYRHYGERKQEIKR